MFCNRGVAMAAGAQAENGGGEAARPPGAGEET